MLSLSRHLLIILVILSSPGFAQDQGAGKCLARDAVYRADASANGIEADQLRFKYDGNSAFGMPSAEIISAELGFEVKLLPYMTNSSGAVGMTGEIPFEKLPKWMQDEQRETAAPPGKDPQEEQTSLPLHSASVVVYEDFSVGDLPAGDKPAPVLVLFPEFRRLAHIRTFEAVGVGIAVGAFRFHRCEAAQP